MDHMDIKLSDSDCPGVPIILIRVIPLMDLPIAMFLKDFCKHQFEMKED